MARVNAKALPRRSSTSSSSRLANAETVWSDTSGWKKSKKDAWLSLRREMDREKSWASGSPKARSTKICLEYSTSGLDSLNVEEVGRLLSDLNKGKPVHEDVVRYMMQAATSEGDASSVSKKELPTLLSRWEEFTHGAEDFEPMMEKYDEECKGHLTKSDVAKLLQDLNKGRTVPEQVLDWVFEEADVLENGVITLPELPRVISYWSARKSMRRAHRKQCAVQ